MIAKPIKPKSIDSVDWYVLCVKPRMELRIADMLTRMNIEVFCPVVRETRQWSDRRKKVDVPLFKLYVFVKISKRDRVLVLQVPGVLRYLFWEGKPAKVRDSEIATIKDWLQDDSVDEVLLSQYAPGKHITINKGVFKNQHALVERNERKNLKLILKDLGVILYVKIKELV